MDELYELAGQRFAWDSAKAQTNWRKHGVRFEEAASVFLDEAAVLHDDPDHSGDERRFLALGYSYLHRMLVVVSAERGDVVRLISARKAGREESRSYGEQRR